MERSLPHGWPRRAKVAVVIENSGENGSAARGTETAAHDAVLDPARAEAFIRANTRLRPDGFVPEVPLYLADQSLPIWEKTEAELEREGLAPPFWAFAWAGGLALARHILDNPGITAGRSVLDLGAGSGLAGIAACRTGALSVLAADVDPFACAAAALNAAANGVRLQVEGQDLLAGHTSLTWDVILVGDLFYERALAGRVLAFLDRSQAQGAQILTGDPGRTYFPYDRFEVAGVYDVPVSRELEDAEVKRTTVWRLRPVGTG